MAMEFEEPVVMWWLGKESCAAGPRRHGGWGDPGAHPVSTSPYSQAVSSSADSRTAVGPLRCFCIWLRMSATFSCQVPPGSKGAQRKHKWHTFPLACCSWEHSPRAIVFHVFQSSRNLSPNKLWLVLLVRTCTLWTDYLCSNSGPAITSYVNLDKLLNPSVSYFAYLWNEDGLLW